MTFETQSFGRRGLVLGLAVVLALLAGCSGSSDDPSSAPPVTTAPAKEPLTFVALGDSWAEGGHCGSCETFAGRYADGLQGLSGRPVEFVDFTGQAQPFVEESGGGTRSLLRAFREDASFADQVASGDVIMIETGSNEMERALDSYAEGRCGARFACVQPLEDLWRRNFDVILDEIERLRGDQPTAIRLVSGANFLLSEPGAREGLPPDAIEFGDRVFEALNATQCDAARQHGAICVDVRPILNGPTLDQPVDENSEESMQAVADALLATGLPEFQS